jgi:hypothetical protein
MIYQPETAITYQWRKGFPHHGVPAQQVGEALAEIHATYGDITPEKICLAAAKADSPLHPFIEWDRRKAAIAYRLQQATALRGACQRVVVYYIENAEQHTVVQAFVAHPLEKRPQNGTGGHCFVPVAQVLSEPQARAAHIQRALDELAAWRKRYETFLELSELFTAIDAEIQRLSVLHP